MYNYGPPLDNMDTASSYSYSHQDVTMPISSSTNKYVYIKQSFIHTSQIEPKTTNSKVLVNPHFNKKVFVNPNFTVKSAATSTAKIHVNPNIKKINFNEDDTKIQRIHVNPNVLKNLPFAVNPNQLQMFTEDIKTSTFIKRDDAVTKKISVTPVNSITSGSKFRKRRSSIRSKFKIVKSSIFDLPLVKTTSPKPRNSFRSKYKIVKSTSSIQNCSHVNPTAFNKFKLDNRRKDKEIISPQKNKKYVYVNRFLSISDIARNNLLKGNGKYKKSNLVNISGIFYKKTPHCLQKASTLCSKTDVLRKQLDNSVSKSKFKFIRKTPATVNQGQRILRQPKLRSPKVRNNVLLTKLRKCNIPCPYYRKFGRCRGKDNGKCYRKHNPDQIALCTKFLQGACVDEKCLLSHNVSPEKMPTCKFYLEGSCAKDNCPYLHVRINPKADICKDFLEGFCKRAFECDKRHQFLCPDYEKNGNCLKQRCPYPHGRMVRKYSVFIKTQFAKKSSACKKEIGSSCKNKQNSELIGKEIFKAKSEPTQTKQNLEVNVNNRYYKDQKVIIEDKRQEDKQIQQNCNNIRCDQETGLRSRPKLGMLPSFIALEDEK
ncbi:hypothetical protein NQ317_018140 [Molorchus minor]|uniref:C3H1-type domain-containing protein n=1 Tax=Molorchus minor TaxID=1323400 RepID=A0ABQ9J8F9_9CUCU|nr:hypothetical protein NQ317_018140 [Molorchus minor]